jgi:hypothetical protein
MNTDISNTVACGSVDPNYRSSLPSPEQGTPAFPPTIFVRTEHEAYHRRGAGESPLKRLPSYVKDSNEYFAPSEQDNM